MPKKNYSNLKILRKNEKNLNSPHISILEKIKNPHAETYNVRFSVPEFTSICPVTDQPDFALLIIDYVPDKWIVESKSFKLFVHSFRNHGSFHEDCTVFVGKTLYKLLKPKWIQVGGYWNPRGGIPIDIFFQLGKKPINLWVPEHNVSVYKGR